MTGTDTDRIAARLKVVDEHVRHENDHNLEAIMSTFGSTAHYDDKSWDEEAGRRALYAMAADECAALSEIFKSDCHLTSVQIVAFPPLGSNAQPANILNATANYELRPLRQSPAR
jgi:hypothetical protein